MMSSNNGQIASVPPGFRFHPTDEELLYYYLRKKVSYEPIDLDVIREVDLNKLEPWDLKDKCRIGSAGPQNEWYFFSHKDKKYPTGTRTNRATTAGFWKATGRDKAIHLNNSRRIGMRKTLVFYTGRAPHGNKTEWIMHEYRLEDDSTADQVQEDGWVVCRVFKKKNQRGLFQHELADEDHQDDHHNHHQQHQHHHEQHQMMKTTMADHLQPKHQEHDMLSSLHHDINNYGSSSTYSNMHHLPQLFSAEANNSNIMQLGPTLSSFVGPSSTIANMISATYNNNTKLQGNFISTSSSNVDDLDCSHSLLRLTTGSGNTQGDWSFLDKLLASHSTHVSSSSALTAPQQQQQQQQQLLDQAAAAHQQRCPFQYLMGSDQSDVFK